LAPPDEYVEKLKEIAAELLPAQVENIEPVGGGRNSQVFRLRTAPAHSYALKVYFRHASDSRKRMETEYTSLAMLHTHGVRCVPLPVSASQEHGCAIYEWIEGGRIGPDSATPEAVDAATSFVARLADLRLQPGMSALRAASEAQFSGGALLGHLRNRLQPLLYLTDAADLCAFLTGQLVPALERITTWTRRFLGKRFGEELQNEFKTLSSSDFGFHNALRKPDGTIVFLDFEYFGWDDPAKMVSDFLLHPAMNISPALKRRFAVTVVRELAWSSGLRERVEALYPLFGIKWCLILLNEFLPEHLLRRRFSAMTEEFVRQKQTEQLTKAAIMLRRILAEYEHFPYFD
jgi:hypothetical protein